MAISFFIDRQPVRGVADWEDIRVSLDWSGGEVQPQITQDSYTFVDDAKDLILDLSARSVFKEISFDVQITEGEETETFSQILDLKERVVDELGRYIKCPVVKREGRDNLAIKVSGLSFNLLESEGVITDADYQTIGGIIDLDYDPVRSILVLIQTATVTADLIEQGAILAKDILNGVSLAIAGVTGTAASAAWSAGSAIINAAKFVERVITAITLGDQLVKAFIPPKRDYKIISYQIMLEKLANRIGFSLVTSVEDLPFNFYLPSNSEVDTFDSIGLIQITKGTPKGIPRLTDYGDDFRDFIELLKLRFRGRFAIIGTELHFHNIDSPFWRTLSSYELPDILENYETRLNVDELKSSFKISYLTDSTDSYTLTNFKGTNYQRLSKVSEPNMLAGLDTVDIPVALGNVKTELSAFENVLRSALAGIDSLVNFFGGNSNLASRIDGRVGSLLLGSNNYTVPKILYVVNGRIPLNHRDLLSAKSTYENYYRGTSFNYDNFSEQKKLLVSPVAVKFTLFDLIKVNNSRFQKKQTGGTDIELLTLEWYLASDYAVVNFAEQETYETAITETFIEGE